VLNQHRLAVDSAVIREDTAVAANDPQYSFMYQLTHLTKARGALRHDDKVEVVARGCRYFRESLAIDHNKAEAAFREKLRDEEFRQYEESALGGTFGRGRRFISGQPEAMEGRRKVMGKFIQDISKIGRPRHRVIR
jgi:hypothetical protein